MISLYQYIRSSSRSLRSIWMISENNVEGGNQQRSDIVVHQDAPGSLENYDVGFREVEAVTLCSKTAFVIDSSWPDGFLV